MNHRILLTFVITFLVTFCFGQKQIDSLKNLILDEKVSSENRADALCKLAIEFNQTNPDSLLFYAIKAYEYADTNGFDEYRSKAKAIQGSAFHKKGDYTDSEKAYNKAIEFARKIGDSVLVGDNMYSVGVLYADRGDYDKALNLYTNSVDLLEGKDENLKMANVVNNMAIIYIRKGDYDQGSLEFERSIELYKISKDPAERSGPMINLAILKTRQGDYAKAIDLYTQSLTIDEQAGNDYNSAYSYLNIANLYYNQGNHKKFFEHANKSLEIREKLGDKPGIVRCLSSIGIAHYENKELQKAIQVLEKAKPIAEEINLKNYISQIALTIGEIQIDQEKFELAYGNINHALIIANELDDNVSIAKCLTVLGRYYIEQGNNNKALSNLNKAFELVEGKDLELTKDIALKLYEVHSDKGQAILALKNYELYITLRDSINSSNNKQEIVRQEFKYKYEKKALADSISFAGKQEIQKTKLKQASIQRFTLLIVLAIVLGFSVMLYNRIRLIKKQKNTIEDQNNELHNLNENLEEKVVERTKKIVQINTDLKKSDERYTYALEASNDGIWDYNVKENKISFSPAIYTMLGYIPNEFPQTREAIYNLLHSEDLKNNKRKSHDLFITQNKQDYFLDEYRLISKGGDVVWIQVKGKVVEKDDNNNPLRIVGTHTDITADKRKNQEMLKAVLKTEDAERSRISKEIHDGLQQTLTISLLNFQNLKKDLKGLGAKSLEKFNLGWKYLQNSISESRNVAHTLMPKAIVELGILTAFENLIDTLNRSQESTKFHFTHNLKAEKMANQQIEITFYRILQEAINNINKYAKASNVYVQLKEYDDIYMLTIEDNGVGFDMKSINKEGAGLGFKSMKNRLDAIDGYLEINSNIGKGTSILVEVNKSENS